WGFLNGRDSDQMLHYRNRHPERSKDRSRPSSAGSTTKKSVGIEILLQWAVNEEWPKNEQVMQMVQRVNKRRPALLRSFGPVFELTNRCLDGEAHRDAITIAERMDSFHPGFGQLDEATVVTLLGPLA